MIYNLRVQSTPDSQRKTQSTCCNGRNNHRQGYSKTQNETKTGNFPAKNSHIFKIIKWCRGTLWSLQQWKLHNATQLCAVQTDHPQQMVTVTLMLKLPDWSAKSRATLASKTRQSLDATADATPSCTLRGVASHVRRRFTPFSSSLHTTAAHHHTITLETPWPRWVWRFT